jgi:hypothetical protein
MDKKRNDTIRANFKKSQLLKQNIGLREGYGVWEDTITELNGEVFVDRTHLTDDGGFIEVEEVTEEYEDEDDTTQGGH